MSRFQPQVEGVAPGLVSKNGRRAQAGSGGSSIHSSWARLMPVAKWNIFHECNSLPGET